ncbi:MAG TPA: hypothetical protein VFR58_10970 [Flavisolibacter sp.]|nr:hypothetical protein [Flavisolibacter sp.]
MKQQFLFILTFLSMMLLACTAQRNYYKLYKMEDFDLNAGNLFIKKIQYLPAINDISIVDTKADGNDFVVNRQWILIATTKTDQPNYYNIKKRAQELLVHPDSLINCVKVFYKIGVNGFNRDSGHYRFRVVVGLTTNRGYLYIENRNVSLGDTLPATSVRNRDYQFNVVLTRQLDKNWFEYYETR